MQVGYSSCRWDRVLAAACWAPCPQGKLEGPCSPDQIGRTRASGPTEWPPSAGLAAQGPGPKVPRWCVTRRLPRLDCIPPPSRPPALAPLSLPFRGALVGAWYRAEMTNTSRCLKRVSWLSTAVVARGFFYSLEHSSCHVIWGKGAKVFFFFTIRCF